MIKMIKLYKSVTYSDKKVINFCCFAFFLTIPLGFVVY